MKEHRNAAGLRRYNVMMPWAWSGDASDEEGTYSTAVWAKNEPHARLEAATEMADSGEKCFGFDDDDDDEDTAAERQRYIDTRVEGWADVYPADFQLQQDLIGLFEEQLFGAGYHREIDMQKLGAVLAAHRDEFLMI